MDKARLRKIYCLISIPRKHNGALRANRTKTTLKYHHKQEIHFHKNKQNKNLAHSNNHTNKRKILINPSIKQTKNKTKQTTNKFINYLLFKHHNLFSLLPVTVKSNNRY